MKALSALALLSGIALLSACGAGESSSVQVWSNRADLLPFADIFNGQRDDIRIEMIYRENPSHALDREPAPPDLIIAEHLAGAASIRRFRTLDRIFDRRTLKKSDFYNGLLALGQKDGQQVLVPLSFNLPAVAFDTHFGAEITTRFMLGFEDIRTFARAFNRERDGRFVNLGFSPLWQPDFMVSAAMAFNAAFTEDPGRVPVWNERNLGEAVEFIRTWIDTDNGGFDSDRAFSDKYLYNPLYKSLTEGRIKFSFTTAADFFMLPESRRAALDIRWLSHKGRIMAVDETVFVGIPLRSRNVAGAEAFLEWMFSLDTQRMILPEIKRRIPYSFGVASGFSSLFEINERYLPEHYPALLGQIPPRELIVFPHPLPSRWTRFRSEVLQPWMISYMSGQRSLNDLQQRVTTWSLNLAD